MQHEFQIYICLLLRNSYTLQSRVDVYEVVNRLTQESLQSPQQIRVRNETSLVGKLERRDVSEDSWTSVFKTWNSTLCCNDFNRSPALGLSEWHKSRIKMQHVLLFKVARLDENPIGSSWYNTRKTTGCHVFNSNLESKTSYHSMMWIKRHEVQQKSLWAGGPAKGRIGRGRGAGMKFSKTQRKWKPKSWASLSQKWSFQHLSLIPNPSAFRSFSLFSFVHFPYQAFPHDYAFHLQSFSVFKFSFSKTSDQSPPMSSRTWFW